jgi:2-polyprenyl-3-methyl-5-hydroxy-6-metoxy-1,4-benzoquinol methylase
MKWEQRNSCPLCGSKRFRVHRRGSFDPEQIGPDHFKITDSHYGQLWNFFKCRDCGFVFSNPTLNEKDLEAFYQALEDPEYSLESEGRSRNFKTILKRLKKLDKPGHNLLDIGAASGIFLNLAREQDYLVQGIEPSQFLVEQAQKMYGITLFQGTIDTFESADRFSVITLVDILEHLSDPESFMSRLEKLIQKDGILVIVTPDIDSLAVKLTGKKWWHYRIAHLNFFNRRSLKTLLANHGFEIIKFNRYAWHFSVFYLFTRLFPGLKQKKSLQKILKKVHLKLQLFDSWEIYARKR